MQNKNRRKPDRVGYKDCASGINADAMDYPTPNEKPASDCSSLGVPMIAKRDFRAVMGLPGLHYPDATERTWPQI